MNDVVGLRKMVNACFARENAQMHLPTITLLLMKKPPDTKCETVFYTLIALKRCLGHYTFRKTYFSTHPQMVHQLLAIARKSPSPRFAHIACDCIALCAMHPVQGLDAATEHMLIECLYSHFTSAINDDVRVQTMWSLCVFASKSAERAGALLETCVELQAICDKLGVPYITRQAKKIIINVPKR